MTLFVRPHPLLAALLACACCHGAWAQSAEPASAPEAPTPAANKLEGWDLSFSPYTYHFTYSSEHKPVVSLGVVKGLEDNWNAGGSVFSNSFGQPSVYLFGGQRYVNPFGWDKWYLQWNAGLLYGYVGQYKNKVPLNYKGFSPGFVPSVGYQFSEGIYGELDLLGNSALMFTLIFPMSKWSF